MRVAHAMLALLLAGAAPAASARGAPVTTPTASQRWSTTAATGWYDRQPWLVGANYIPATAINELEMWQAESFDPARIDLELGWAEKAGMNTMRVFLHDLLWKQDPAGFTRRIDQFLAIAARHHIRPVLVLFDSCWDPDPKLGPQHPPIPGIHNSGWVQSPSRHDLVDPAQRPRFEAYVKGVVGRFAHDPRVLAWDVWNEPDNEGGGSYVPLQLPGEQAAIETMLPQVFAWARAAGATQPLTSGVWRGGDWSPGSRDLSRIQRIQLEHSDVISFHNYDWPEQFEARIAQLRPYGRPLMATEWMARGNGSTVDTILPVGKRERVAMFNWGLVQGRTQTNYPWDSWERPYTLQQPQIWFHEIFRNDGTPYRAREVETFQALTGRETKR
jgi:hypothetical protein